MKTHEDKRYIRGNQTVAALMRSAEIILAQKENTNDLTVEEICSRCQVTKGAFYHHFASKESFFRQVYTLNMTAYMVKVIEAAYQRYPHDPIAQIRAWIEGVARYTQDNQREMAKYLYRGEPSEHWIHRVSGWSERVRTRLAQWQAHGILRSDVPAQALHQYLDSFTYGMSSLALQGYIQLPLDERLVDAFIGTVLKAAQP